MQIDDLRGSFRTRKGLSDLAAGAMTEAALLVLVGAPRLREIGIAVPHVETDRVEHRLYALLERDDPDGAHSRYNALIRSLVSFERATECARLAEAERIARFMRALGEAAGHETHVYFTGGVSAVLMGWRRATIDLDIEIVPERDELLRAIPALKERLEINVELAAPSHFIPALPGWEDRSPFIAREGLVAFHHYDFYAQALANIERGHEQDRADVAAMLAQRLVEPDRLRALFEAIVPQLHRYPAINPESLRRAVDRAIAENA